MDYYQQQEVNDTKAVTETMERAIKMIVAIGEAQIKKYPRSEISGTVQDFLDGLDDLKADTFEIAKSEAERIENDCDYAEYQAERHDVISMFNARLGVR